MSNPSASVDLETSGVPIQMAITTAWFSSSERTGQPLVAARRPSIGPLLTLLLARRDDRLLRDAGLTREEVLGEAAFFWAEWSRQRTPWDL